jgi:hypothetical protein
VEAVQAGSLGVLQLEDLHQPRGLGRGGHHPQLAALGLADALVLLRAHAYAAERPILTVARDVIARDLHFRPEDDHHE